MIFEILLTSDTTFVEKNVFVSEVTDPVALRIPHQGDEDPKSIPVVDALNRYARLHDVSLQELTDLMDDDEALFNSDLLAAEPLISFGGGAEKPGSEYDAFTKNSAKLLDLCEYDLRLWGHGHVLYSNLKFSQ